MSKLTNEVSKAQSSRPAVFMKNHQLKKE